MVSKSLGARLQPHGRRTADNSLLRALSIVICGLVCRSDLRVVRRFVIGRSGVLCHSLCESHPSCHVLCEVRAEADETPEQVASNTA
jgi:hypothetical protein